MMNEGHTNVKRQFRVTKANHRHLTNVLLNLVVYMFEFVDSLFSVKRVANYCRISQIPVLVFSSKVSSYNCQKLIQCGRTTNVTSASPRSICSSSTLNQLLTVVRENFERKTRTVSITYWTVKMNLSLPFSLSMIYTHAACFILNLVLQTFFPVLYMYDKF